MAWTTPGLMPVARARLSVVMLLSYSILMHGLRVYINTVGTDNESKHGVFYSRRDTGPYYRWHYVEEKSRWCSSRVRLDLVPNSLRMAQKAVPNALRAELLSHYLD